MTRKEFDQMRPQTQERLIRGGFVPNWWTVKSDKDSPKQVRSVFNPTSKEKNYA